MNYLEIIFMFINLIEIIQNQGLSSIDTLAKYSYEENEKFIRVFLSLPDEVTGVFGLIESSESSVIFEMRYGLNGEIVSLPVEDINLSITNATKYCKISNINDTFMNFEIEIEQQSITVRAKNAEQYELQNPLLNHEHFRLLFFMIDIDDDVCVVPAITTKSDKSEYYIPHPKNPISPINKLSRFNFKIKTTPYPHYRRATTMRAAYASTTKNTNVRFATFKHVRPNTTKKTTGSWIY